MQEDIKFKEIGKKTPYKVPDGFFEQVSEKTLLKAKKREQNRRKNLVLWRTMAVVASLAAIFILGYFIPRLDLKPDSNRIAQDNQPSEQPMIQQKQQITIIPSVAEKKKVVPEKVTEKAIAVENDTEDVSDVLAELSDEELLQLSVMYKTDPFIAELSQ